MPDYVINFLLCLFIFWVGFRAGRIHAVIKIAKEVAAQINEQPNKEVLLQIEKHDEHYFLYNEEHKFLAQGSNFIEMLSNLKDRFPGQDFKFNKYQETLSEEEMGQMIKAIFEVFGNKSDTNEKQQNC